MIRTSTGALGDGTQTAGPLRALSACTPPPRLAVAWFERGGWVGSFSRLSTPVIIDSSLPWLSELPVGSFTPSDYKGCSYKNQYGLSIFMEARPGKEQIGGSAVHVGDCYIWAAISYLDSPTDYRECLPHGRRQTAVSDDELVMLDERAHALWAKPGAVTIFAFLTSMFLMFLLRVWE